MEKFNNYYISSRLFIINKLNFFFLNLNSNNLYLYIYIKNMVSIKIKKIFEIKKINNFLFNNYYYNFNTYC